MTILWALRAIPAAPCCLVPRCHIYSLFVEWRRCLVISARRLSNHIVPCSPTTMATPDAALKLEIARLTGIFFRPFHTPMLSLSQNLGAINRHRSGQGQGRPPHSTTRTTYVNPSYKPPSSKPQVLPEYKAAGVTPTTSSRPSPTVRPPSGPGPSLSQPHDVTIDGVVFESSKRSLVRKDSASITSSTQPFAQYHSQSCPLPNPLHLVPVLVCNPSSAGIN